MYKYVICQNIANFDHHLNQQKAIIMKQKLIIIPGLDKLGLRGYGVASRARTLWAHERLRETEWANMSQSEPELARVTVADRARDRAIVIQSQRNQKWVRVSQSELEWLVSQIELVSRVPCSQLIMLDNKREIGSQSASLREKLAHKQSYHCSCRLAYIAVMH